MWGLSPLFNVLIFLYPFSIVLSRCLQSLLYNLVEGDDMKSLLSYVYVVICPNIHCSGCFSSQRSFYCLLIGKLWDVMVDKFVLQMGWTLSWSYLIEFWARIKLLSFSFSTYFSLTCYCSAEVHVLSRYKVSERLFLFPLSWEAV